MHVWCLILVVVVNNLHHTPVVSSLCALNLRNYLDDVRGDSVQEENRATFCWGIHSAPYWAWYVSVNALELPEIMLPPWIGFKTNTTQAVDNANKIVYIFIPR